LRPGFEDDPYLSSVAKRAPAEYWKEIRQALRWNGQLVAVLIRWLMPLVPAPPVTLETVTAPDHEAAGKGGFGLLFAIGVLDSAARMGFLLFLPFLLKAKGASLTTVGLALSLVFIGGAFGKAACGWLGARLGLLATVVTTEVGTAAAILTVLALPLAPSLALLPLLGVMLNGTSSVLYGTVPELVTAKRIERAFALFYTGILGSSALAPVLYGRLGDAAGPVWAAVAAALTALAVVPLMLLLSPRLAPSANAQKVTDTAVVDAKPAPAQIIRIMNLADPLHPTVAQEFKGVTATSRDAQPGLILLANADGIWILQQHFALDPAVEKSYAYRVLYDDSMYH
jgi:MFS family permease